MGPKIDLQPYLAQLRTWVQEEGVSYDEICTRLHDQHGISVGYSTLRRALGQADIRARGKDYKDSAELRARIVYLFHAVQTTDEESIRILKHDGFEVGQRRLQQMRLAMGLLKRIPPERRQEVDAAMKAALDQEMEQGHLEDYGRMQLYTYIRSKYNIVGRYCLAAIWLLPRSSPLNRLC